MSNDKTMLYITKLQELKLLDHKAKTPAFIFVFLRGVIGLVLFIIGLALAYCVFTKGLLEIYLTIGIMFFSVYVIATNYFYFKIYLEKRKNIYSPMIIEITNKLLNNL